MDRVTFALKPALLGAQYSISHKQAHWFYRESSPLCPACVFLCELAYSVMCLSCSRDRAGNANVLVYVLIMQELVLWGFSATMQHLPALHYCACTATACCMFWKSCLLLPPSSHPQCDLSEISRFTVAHQTLGLGLAGYVLRWRREPDTQPVNSVKKAYRKFTSELAVACTTSLSTVDHIVLCILIDRKLF